MLAELFDRLQAAAGYANDQRILKAPAEPPHNYYLKDSAGGLHLVTAQAAPEQSRAFGLASLAERVKDLEPDGDGPDVRPDVWYCRQRVVGSLGVRDPRRYISFTPEVTPQFKKLESLLGSKETMDQKALLKMLRIDLDGVGGVEQISDSIATVQFNHAQQATGVVARGQSSMGESIRSQLAGVERVPDKTILRLPVFSNVGGTEVGVRVVVDIDVENSRFRLLPLPGEIERAYQYAEDVIHDSLVRLFTVKDSVVSDIYYGTP